MRTPTQITEIEENILSITTMTFCFLGLIVFCYYVKRRYLLALLIKSVSVDDLMMPHFQNLLKNLKIKVLINNFIIIIVVVEVLFNVSFSVLCLPSWREYFNASDPIFFWYLDRVKLPFYCLFHIAYNCHISTTCLVLKVLWLTYLHCPYKDVLVRWTGYITLRCAVFLGIYLLVNCTEISQFYQIELLVHLMKALVLLADLVIYLVYSRRFYRHLKSRETEARLFKDRAAYLTERSIRLHFRMASIVLAFAFCSLTIPECLYNLASIPNIIIHSTSVHCPFILELILVYFDHVVNIGYIVYTLLMSFCYLYFASMLFFRYLVGKRRLNCINRKIKPLIFRYHNSIHYSRFI